MSPPRLLRSDVYSVGAIDWDRRLFDDLIPLPDGTSYNAYLVCGSEKTALIDTVDPTMSDVLIDNLRRLGIEKIDYIVVNHAEQDHSGTLPEIIEKHPSATVVASPKCKQLLVEMLLIPEYRITAVADRESLSLGNKTLEFIHAPWVHWPETMLTYLREDKILFSCDLFGSHMATSDLYAPIDETTYESARRYYAEIMMPFRSEIKKHLLKIKDLKIDLIAPSHGPVHSSPERIVDLYRLWSSDELSNTVVLPYISMHGSTKRMVDFLVSELLERGIAVKQFNLAVTDVGKLAASLVDAATVVFGSPTVLTGPHPSVVYAAYLTAILRPKVKFVSIIGSYGWGTRMVKRIEDAISGLKAEMIEPVVVKGYPEEKDFEALKMLADEILKRHRELGMGAG